MGKTTNIRVVRELELELKEIQKEMKKKIADVNLTHNQASQIAAKRLMEWRVKNSKL